MDQAMQRLARASRRLVAASTVFLVLVPVVLALFWALLPLHPDLGLHLPVKVDSGLPISGQVMAFFASMIPGAVTMYGLWLLRRLFGLYQRGVVFETDNVECYRRLGWVLIAFAIARFISQPILSVVLTLHHPPGHRMLAVGLSSDDVVTVLVGAVVLTISWVMDEAHRMKQEYEMFV